MPRRIPASIWIGVGAGLLFFTSLFLVFFVSMKKESDEEICRINLHMIGMAIRDGELLTSPKWDAVQRGRAFFASHETWPCYQKIPFDPCCPVKNARKEIDYRGPARPFREIRNEEPIAADRVGNHGPGKGGNVLLKTGHVYTVPEGHPLWAAAAQTTSD
jgi:hypothetical protein